MAMTTDAEIKSQIDQRNVLRTEANLPRLDATEFAKLRSAREARIMEAVFAVERIRFEKWIAEGSGFWCKAGRWSSARQQVAKELHMGKHLDHLFRELGYRLVKDCWGSEGRKTYVHDDEADRTFLTDLAKTLAEHGFKMDRNRLRCYLNDVTGELIEIESGGAETSGHFVHHLRSG